MLGAQKFVAVTVNKRGCGQHSYVLHIPTYLLLHFWQIQKVQHNAAKPLFNWSGGAYARSKHSSEHILLNINGTKCVFSPSFLLQTIWFPNNWQQLCFSTALSYPLPITGRSRCYRHQVNCASSASQWFTLQQQQLPHQNKCACVCVTLFCGGWFGLIGKRYEYWVSWLPHTQMPSKASFSRMRARRAGRVSWTVRFGARSIFKSASVNPESLRLFLSHSGHLTTSPPNERVKLHKEHDARRLKPF